MKKTLLALGMGLIATTSVAQVTFPVKIGFEDADKSELYHCKYANNVGLSEFGDWVNPHQDTDVWTEQDGDAAKNGDYGFLAKNTDKLNPWDRGFKLANLPIQEGKSYRMSFWLKGNTGQVLKAYISKGVEQLDKSFVNPAGGAVYGLNGENDYTISTDDWKHVSFIAYNHGAAPFNSWLTNTSWAGGAIVGNCIPESLWSGAGINDSNKEQSYRAFFNGEVPEIYFAIINMYDGGEFMVDDILIEEDKYFNQATFNMNAIKLDFGYATNISTLAGAVASKTKTKFFEPTQFKVTVDGSEKTVVSAEGKTDGYIYLFLEDNLDDNADITVSYTPAADSELLYGADKRPSNESTDLVVYGFENEVAYFDESIEVETAATSIPEILSYSPENGSFDLPTSTNEFTITFDSPTEPSQVVAVLKGESGDLGELELTQGASSDVLIAKYNGAELKKGSYTIEFTISDAAGFEETEEPVVYKFSVGNIPMGDSKPYTAFQDAFDSNADQSCPNNWVHVEDGEVKVPGKDYNYNGGRLFKYADGGDFVTGMYIRYYNGTFSFGDRCNYEGQKDKDGNLIEAATDEDYLKLEAGSYRLSYNFIGWKNDGNTHTITCQIYALDDAETILGEATTTTTADTGGSRGNKVNGSVQEIIEFQAPEAGNYVIKFSNYGNEVVVGNIKLDYVPGDVPGIAEKSALMEAYEAVMTQIEEMELLDNADRYTGAETDLLNEISKKYDAEFEGKEDYFAYDGTPLTAPSQFNDLTTKFKQAVTDAKNHVVQINEYYNLVETIQSTVNVDETEKVTKTQKFADAVETAAKYMNGDEPKVIKDSEELAAAIKELQNAIDQVNYMKGVSGNGFVGISGIPALTARINMALTTIEAMEITDLEDSEVETIAKGMEATTDDDAIANALNKIITKYYYKAMTGDEETKEAFFDYKYSENEDGELVEIADGTYNFSSFLKNPNIYIQTSNGNIAGSLTATNIGTEEEPENVYAGDACPGWTVSEYNNGSWSTGWASLFRDDIPVEAMASNWGGSYTISQTIENLPAGQYILKGGITERSAYQDDSYFFWQTSADEDRMTLPVPNVGQAWNTDNISSARYNAIFVDGNEATEEGEEPVEDMLVEILDGKLTVGAHAGESSCIFINNFRIYLVSAAENFNYKEAYETGVNSIKNDKVVKVAVYDMNGRQMLHAGKGVNIVKRTYSDGSVKVSKLLVK